MSEYSFEVITSDVEKEVARIESRLTGPSLEVFLEEQVTPFLQLRGEERFAGEGDELTGKWRPLEPRTRQIRQYGYDTGWWDVGPDHPINVRTHALEHYITTGVGDITPTGAGAALVFPGLGGLQGDIKEKVTLAQKGSPGGRTPARPVLAVGERDLEHVLSRLVDHIMDEL